MESNRPAPVGGATSTVLDIPDHVLELILLRLDSSVWLVRAASACKRWCRVVADAGFQGRFRSLRGPLTAGRYLTVDPKYESPPAGGNCNHVFVPSSTLAVSSSPFNLDFLPANSHGTWQIVDSRGGLLLLCCGDPHRLRSKAACSPGDRYSADLVVCDPLARRHQSIPCLKIPSGHRYLGMFLLDGGSRSGGGGGRRIGASSFGVIVALHRHHAFKPGRGVPVGRLLSLGGWTDVRRAWKSEINIPNTVESFFFAGRAHGSLYWGIKGARRTALVLEAATAEFSTTVFPENVDQQGSYDRGNLRVVGGGEDATLRVVRFIAPEYLEVLAHGGGEEWAVENQVRLSEAARGLPGNKDWSRNLGGAMIVDANETHVLVTPHKGSWLFSIKLKTMEAERKPPRNKYAGPAYSFELPWPPILNLKCLANRHNVSK